jgi:hypothetical protein
MAAEGMLTAAERQLVIDRRLDEIDRALLGLLPRAERLAVVASVEARVQALGEDAPIAELVRDVAVELPGATTAPFNRRSGARRSRLAFTAGVLGIITVAALIISPILFIGLSMVAEIVGETAAIALMGMFTLLLCLGGGFAVCGGGASLFRLAGRGQTNTGMGWAITGLCTGAVPMLIGVVSLLALGGQMVESQASAVTWSASPAGPVAGQVYAQTVDYPQAAMMPPSPYGELPPSGAPTYSPGPLPPALPPDARNITKTQLMPESKPSPKTEPATSLLLPTAPPSEKVEEVEADD